MSANVIANSSPLDKVKDNRGAIMVVGIFFACVMIGWMWMLVGLGDAMIWRDRSQEAADSMSYSSAAIQAQGMNLISFINILMLILTAVYLLMSFVYNILDFMHVVLGSDVDNAKCMPTSCGVRKADMTLLSQVPYLEWLEPVANYWCDAAKIVGELHDGRTNGAPGAPSVGWLLGGLETIMVDTMPVLSTFEDFVSYAFPWAGELVGAYTATQYKDWGKDRWGLPISATLIPATTSPGQPGTLMPAKKYASCADPKCSTPLNCDAHDPQSCAQYNGGDKREGLPVEIPDNGFTAICDYASAKVSTAAKNAVSSMLGGGMLGTIVGTLTGWVTKAIGSAVTNAYCKHDSTGLFHGADDTVASILIPITAIQTGGWKNKEKCPHDNWGHGNSGSCGGPDTCNKVYEMQYKNQNFWEDPSFAGGPHLVVQYASNGNDWMQVWGAVWGGNRVEQSEKLVGVAGMDSNGSGTWNTIIPQNSESLFSLYLSQAEFYFDCNDKWSTDACNKNNNASYNIAWRARLRRVRGLSWGQDLFGYVWNGSLGSTFDGEVKKVISGAMGSAFSNPLVGKGATLAANAGYTALKGYAGNALGSAFNPASAIPDYIH